MASSQPRCASLHQEHLTASRGSRRRDRRPRIVRGRALFHVALSMWLRRSESASGIADARVEVARRTRHKTVVDVKRARVTMALL